MRALGVILIDFRYRPESTKRQRLNVESRIDELSGTDWGGIASDAAKSQMTELMNRMGREGWEVFDLQNLHTMSMGENEYRVLITFRRVSSEMKYEYRVEEVKGTDWGGRSSDAAKSQMTELMNRLGREGWELSNQQDLHTMSMGENEYHFLMTFKRST